MSAEVQLVWQRLLTSWQPRNFRVKKGRKINLLFPGHTSLLTSSLQPSSTEISSTSQQSTHDLAKSTTQGPVEDIPVQTRATPPPLPCGAHHFPGGSFLVSLQCSRLELGVSVGSFPLVESLLLHFPYQSWKDCSFI